LRQPCGFPPSLADLQALMWMAREVGRAFRSRLVAADFARQPNGKWIFIEAGPGSCAGTAHEAVFKAVAARLQGQEFPLPSDKVGGGFIYNLIPVSAMLGFRKSRFHYVRTRHRLFVSLPAAIRIGAGGCGVASAAGGLRRGGGVAALLQRQAALS